MHKKRLKILNVNFWAWWSQLIFLVWLFTGLLLKKAQKPFFTVNHFWMSRKWLWKFCIPAITAASTQPALTPVLIQSPVISRLLNFVPSVASRKLTGACQNSRHSAPMDPQLLRQYWLLNRSTPSLFFRIRQHWPVKAIGRGNIGPEVVDAGFPVARWHSLWPFA